MSEERGQTDDTRLFPLATADGGDSGEEKLIAFKSFKPCPETTKSELEGFLSSDDDPELDKSNRSPQKKRTREIQPTQSDTSKKKRSRTREEEMHFIDKLGDQQNKLYEGIYRLDVSSYRRLQLAASARHRNDRWYPDHDSRYFAPKFLNAEKSRKLRRMKFTNVLCPSLNTDVHGIVQLSKTERGSDDEEVMESIEEGIRRRTKELNISIRERPYELEPWMALTSFQDDIASLIRRRVSVTSTAEKKLSILATALKFHPKNEELLCQMLRLYAVVSSPAQGTERYQAVLAQVPHSLTLWRSYWRQAKTSFGDFSCEKMRGILEGGLKGIETGIKNRKDIAVNAERTEEDLVAAFISHIQFDLQSGYNEKAVAKIQGILEWTFNCPKNRASISETHLHDLFQRFWESTEIPKIGESGAKGFSAHVDAQLLESVLSETSQREPPPTKTPEAENKWTGWFDIHARDPVEMADSIEEESETDDEDQPEEPQETEADLMKELGIKLEELETVKNIAPEAFERFLETEVTRSNALFLPTKPGSSEDIDVDRLVLFEELQPFLVNLEQPGSKKKLLLAIFLLLGVDVSSLIASCDPFFVAIRSQSDTLLSEWTLRLQSTLSDAGCPMSSWYQEERTRGEFVVHLLEFFSTTLFCSDIRIRKMWLETAVDIEKRSTSEDIPAVITAVGRRLMETQRDDIPLWTAYGSSLARRGLLKEMRRVWKAIVTTMIQRNDIVTDDAVQTIVCEIMDCGEPTPENLWLCAYLSSKDVVYLQRYLSTNHGGPLLEAKVKESSERYFQTRLDAAVSNDLTWESYETILCSFHFRALLLQYSGEKSIDSRCFYRQAASYLMPLLKRLPDTLSRQREAFYETYVRWMILGDSTPKDVKQAISVGLAAIPKSVGLLQMLIRVHSQTHTMSGLLKDVKRLVFREPWTDGVALVLVLEASRNQKCLSLPGLFERVLKLTEDGVLSASPLIWRLYLQIISHAGGVDFKRVFLRSVRACPWSKAVWMEGLRSHHGQIKSHECMEMIETMKDKGVLLRTDVYEILLEEMQDIT